MLNLNLLFWSWRQLHYHRALHKLRRLDDRNLDDINFARAVWGHATSPSPTCGRAALNLDQRPKARAWPCLLLATLNIALAAER